MVTTANQSTTDRIRAREQMTVRELFDHLLLERSKIDQQIEALKPFLGEEEGVAATIGARTHRGGSRAAAGAVSLADTSGRMLGIAAFIQETLHPTRPTKRQELVRMVAEQKNLPLNVAREKVKSSLKDLARRGRVVKGKEPGEYLKPKK